MEACDAPDCSREMGHDGPHGHALGSAVLAPYSDMPQPEPAVAAMGSAIPCNACGAPLRLHPERTRAECTGCDQRIAFVERGYPQTVLPRLYPAKMTDPKMMREYADHRVAEWEFFDRLRLEFGLIDEAEYAARRTNDERVRAKYIADEVVPLEKKIKASRWCWFWPGRWHRYTRGRERG